MKHEYKPTRTSQTMTSSTMLWLVNLATLHAVFVDTERMNSGIPFPFTDREVDLNMEEKIENGILPNQSSITRAHPVMLVNNTTGRLEDPEIKYSKMVEPHTRVFKNIRIPYNYKENVVYSLRMQGPLIDRHLLYGAGMKIAQDCKQGFCNYIKNHKSHHSRKGGFGLYNDGNYVFDGTDMHGKPFWRDTSLNNMINGLPSEDDNIHYNYHTESPAERYSVIENPFKPSSKTIHVTRPQDREFAYDDINAFNG